VSPCSLRVSAWDDEALAETDFLWLGEACVCCRKPLGLDGVVLVCFEHGILGYHSVHKRCLDGSPLRSVPLGSPPVLLREVLQLGLFKVDPS
jgi:hypothetical protein